MSRCFALLDPGSSDPDERRALALWLSVQKHFAFRPQDAVTAFEGTTDPGEVLRGAGAPALRVDRLERAFEKLARLGALALPLTSPAYPERLRRLSDAAPLLVLRGDPGALHAPCVAIVGARAATAYGLAVAEQLGRELAAVGLVIVSGLARGVDAAAHRGALEAGGRTVAFQACGADRVYPAEHQGLAERIAATGAVVSELPLGTPPRAPHFPLRNRLISALALGTVVVEARERSGTLVTARHSADQGGEVLAVPGPIDAPTSRGPNTLIRDGARPVLESADVLRELGFRSSRAAAAEASADERHRDEAGEAPSAAAEGLAGAILGVLGFEPLTRDELALRLDQRPESLAVELVGLELAGRITEDRDGRLRVVGTGARAPRPGGGAA